MSVQGTEKRKLQRVIDTQGNTNLIHPETSADMVLVDNADAGITATTVQGALKEIAGGATGAVHYNKAQTLTAEQKKQARDNIGAGTSSFSGNYNDLDGKPTIPTVNNGKLIVNYKSAANGTPTKLGEFTANQANDTNIDIDTSGKYDKTGGTISGNVTITGNLTVNGATTTIESTTLKVEDKLIEVAKDNKAVLASPAGIFVPKYDGTNNSALVINGEGNAQVGDVVLDANGNINVSSSDLQTLATRDDNLVDGKLVKFDGTTKKLVTDTTEYQTKTDDGLKTTDKTVVGAINEVKGTADANVTMLHNIVNTGAQSVKHAEKANGLDHKISITNPDESTANGEFDIKGRIDLYDLVGAGAGVTWVNTTMKLHIRDNAVKTKHIADANVTTEKIKDGAVTKAKLATGLGATGTYTAVTVDNGIVTAGGKSIEFGTSGQTTPSNDLMVGGLFFELVQ